MPSLGWPRDDRREPSQRGLSLRPHPGAPATHPRAIPVPARGTPKNGRIRTVGMPGFLVDELSSYVSTIPRDGLLFPDERGGPLRGTNWKPRVFDPAAAYAGLTPPPLRVHDLRHTSASLAISAGADVKKLQNQLGHSSATLTLDLYGHLYPDELDAFTAALDALRVRPAADSARTVSESATVSEIRK
jgi:integrase